MYKLKINPKIFSILFKAFEKDPDLKEFLEEYNFTEETDVKEFESKLSEEFWMLDEENLIEILKGLNISFIFHDENMEGGEGIITNDFNFSFEGRTMDKEDHYSELAKMYTILSNKSNYDFVVENFC